MGNDYFWTYKKKLDLSGLDFPGSPQMADTTIEFLAIVQAHPENWTFIRCKSNSFFVIYNSKSQVRKYFRDKGQPNCCGIVISGAPHLCRSANDLLTAVQANPENWHS